MKEISTKFTIVLYKPDGTVKHTHTARKRKLARILRLSEFLEAHIVAVYETPDRHRIGSNRWVCDKEHALSVLETFTERPLLEYLGEE